MRKKGGARYRVAATEAAKTFGGIVRRVREEAATYVVERGGVPVAEIRPVLDRRATVADLVDLLHSRGRPLNGRFGRAVGEGVRRLNRRARPVDPWAS
jgi:hypothetical protein